MFYSLFDSLLTICKMFAFFVPFSYVRRIYSAIMCRTYFAKGMAISLQRDRIYSANTIFSCGLSSEANGL